MTKTAQDYPLGPIAKQTLRELLSVWLDFEIRIVKVPIIARLLSGRFTQDDYRRLLLTLRPQVVEGSRWISRTASSLDVALLEERSLVIGHAKEEHRDYLLLEQDFVAIGGTADEIRAAVKNVGGEALHGYMMYQASLPNPIQMIGAMFIIEGLGEKMASDWAKRIQETLNIGEDATRFLSYHGANDESHMGKLYRLLATPALDEARAAQVVKTAEVVARLYRLQLEEIDHVRS